MCDSLSHPFAAGGQSVTLIQCIGNHDVLFAIHEVQGRGILKRNSSSQFERGQSGSLQQMIVATHDFDNLPRQNASSAYRQTRLALVLQQSDNDCVSFDEYFPGAILGQQFVDWIVEVQAEI